MKNIIKILVGSIALAIGGVSTAAVASNIINNQPTAETIQTENTITLNDVQQSKYFVADAPKSEASGFNFTSMITEGIQRGGVNLVGAIAGELGSIALNKIMTSMGVDMRSAEEKKLDMIQTQLTDIQKDLKQGISDVKRKITHMHNEDIMNGLLEKFNVVQTPIASKMAVMIDLAKKELDDKYDKKTLEGEKENFYKSLDMKFEKLDGNNLWNETENLANAVLTPYSSNTSIKLNDLYEETYGTLETWDYMTIAPRRKFIGYVGTIVNSLCQLANIKAAYEMSKFKKGDSNLVGYEVGVKSMINAVNNLNGQFKTELDKLSAIQKKHDEQHLITHRDQVIDNDGNITYKEGKTVSTRLLAVTTGDNDHNYVTYNHDDKNIIVRYETGGQACLPVYANYIYTLDCTDMKDLYKAVINEYKNFRDSYSTDGKKISMQEYLYKAGFSCQEKDMFEKAKGFYSRIDTNSCKGSEDNWWRTDKRHQLRVRYYDFNKANDNEDAITYSEAKEYSSSWFSKMKYSGATTDQLNNSYICFLNPDQKTIEGKITKTKVGEVLNSDTYKSHNYNSHYKGHKKWTGNNDKVVIQ